MSEMPLNSYHLTLARHINNKKYPVFLLVLTAKCPLGKTLNARKVVVPFGGRNHALLMTRSRQKTVIRVEEVWHRRSRRMHTVSD